MACVTIQLEDKLRKTVARQAQALHLTKSAYIRKAIEQMAREIASQELRQSLIQASFACRAESRRINQEFSQIEGDIRENDSTY